MNLNISHTDIGSDQTVLLIHGMASESSAWDITRKNLHFKNYNTITLDLSGHGDSPHKKYYSFNSWVGEILDVLEEKNVSPNIIVGHSLGGLLAAGVAEETPSVERMFLIDPLLHVPSQVMQFLVKKVMSRHQTTDINALRKQHPNWSDSMLMNELVTFHKWDVTSLSALDSEAGWAIANKFLSHKGHAETFVVKPKHSFLLPVKYVDTLTSHNVDVVEVANTGHSIHKDNPREYNMLLDKFIGSATSFCE